MSTEADTCRKYVLPKLYAAGWTDDQINEQRYFTDGRIVKPGKKVDYLLRYKPHYSLAVVEAKVEYKKPGDGLQQAMDYAEALGLKFAYPLSFFPIAFFSSSNRLSIALSLRINSMASGSFPNPFPRCLNALSTMLSVFNRNFSTSVFD